MSVNKKECVVCKELKPSTDYYSAGVKNGKKYLRRKCKKCYERVKEHRRYFNRDWLKDIKSNMECSCCGYSKITHKSFKTQALQFHHYQDNKSFEVSNGVHRGMSIEKIKEEMDKCVVLCSRCHAESHF